jgi:hypothetical protein
MARRKQAGRFDMSPKLYDYRDSDANELLVRFPNCGDYIAELLGKYKMKGR